MARELNVNKIIEIVKKSRTIGECLGISQPAEQARTQAIADIIIENKKLGNKKKV